MKLFTLLDQVTSSYKFSYIPFVSLICIVFAIFTVVNKNPIISLLNLIGLFISVSAYLMLSGLYFIGLSYLLVYVGAISILFIFILMLINIRTSELVTEGKNSLILSVVVLLFISFSLGDILPENILFDFNLGDFSLVNFGSYNNSIETIPAVFQSSWEKDIIEVNHISAIGNVLYTNYSILLIMIALLLLVSIVGAIVITIKKKD